MKPGTDLPVLRLTPGFATGPIVLMTADGAGTMAIRAATGRGKPTIWRWQERYAREGADGLFREAPRGKAFLAAPPEQVAAVVERTLHERPPAATHWTLRSMAKATGLAPSTIHRIWREHGLKPHRFETFKLSNDPKFGKHPARTAAEAGQSWSCLRMALSGTPASLPLRWRGGCAWPCASGRLRSLAPGAACGQRSDA